MTLFLSIRHTGILSKNQGKQNYILHFLLLLILGAEWTNELMTWIRCYALNLFWSGWMFLWNSGLHLTSYIGNPCAVATPLRSLQGPAYSVFVICHCWCGPTSFPLWPCTSPCLGFCSSPFHRTSTFLSSKSVLMDFFSQLFSLSFSAPPLHLWFSWYLWLYLTHFCFILLVCIFLEYEF